MTAAPGQPTGQRPAPPPPGDGSRPSSTADVAQVFGVVFSVLLAVVLADRWASRAAIALTGVAAVLGTGWVYLLARWRRGQRYGRIVGQGLLAVALVAAAVAVSMAGPAPGARALPGGTAGAASAVPLIERIGYALRRSSFIDTNDEDKVDLDTGCPGWGDMHPRIGPSRCGDLADLILDEEGVHTPDGRPRFARVADGATAGYQACAAALRGQPDRNVNAIALPELAAGHRLCVETDRGGIALVRITEVVTDGPGRLPAVTIDFTVWPG